MLQLWLSGGRLPREEYIPLPKEGRCGIMFPKDREEYLKWPYD